MLKNKKQYGVFFVTSLTTTSSNIPSKATTKFISIPIYIHGIAYYTNRLQKKNPLE